MYVFCSKIDVVCMKEIKEDIDYIKKAYENGKTVMYCGVIIDKKKKNIERLYLLSDGMPLNIVLGEIEMWKLDMLENIEIGKNEVDSHIRLQGELDERY